MKERPILFTPENAQKVFDGVKTQTRRLITLPRWAEEVNEDHDFEIDSIEVNGVKVNWPYAIAKATGCLAVIDCPYGEVGDRLWIRESIYIDHFDFFKGPLPQEKPKLDDGMLIYRGEGTCCQQFSECECGSKGAPWRPSIHMPRWACRTVVELTEIRVERLQDMEGQHYLDSDAIAEGVNRIHHGDGQYYYSAIRDEPHPKNWIDPTDAFKELWESILGKGSWDLNPWVWVLTFTKARP